MGRSSLSAAFLTLFTLFPAAAGVEAIIQAGREGDEAAARRILAEDSGAVHVTDEHRRSGIGYLGRVATPPSAAEEPRVSRIAPGLAPGNRHPPPWYPEKVPAPAPSGATPLPMKSYLDIVRTILDTGWTKPNRTGVDAITVPGMMFEHDMAQGFPLLTTKSVPMRLVASELEFFVRGITDKEWLRSRNNHIWDEWCSPEKVPYGHDEETRTRMAAERELGPVYGFQWRHFGAGYRSWDQDPEGEGVDQVRSLVAMLKENPDDRRMIVSAWNPVDFHRMALPPCHYAFQATVTDGRVNLLWNQRSVDVALGLPFNIASYGLLLHLLAKEAGLGEGRLVGFLADTHVYVNHLEGLREQLSREPYPLPTVHTEPFTSIFEWRYEDTRVDGYRHHPRIAFEVAV